jgi:hypothetical protein
VGACIRVACWEWCLTPLVTCRYVSPVLASGSLPLPLGSPTGTELPARALVRLELLQGGVRPHRGCLPIYPKCCLLRGCQCCRLAYHCRDWLGRRSDCVRVPDFIVDSALVVKRGGVPTMIWRGGRPRLGSHLCMRQDRRPHPPMWGDCRRCPRLCPRSAVDTHVLHVVGAAHAQCFTGAEDA